jgi:hypothetical protein
MEGTDEKKKKTMPRTPLLLLLTSLLAPVVGCGGATTSTGAPSETAATPSSDALSPGELAKLDDVLQERIGRDRDTIFPVRVKFTTRPSRTDLTELFLVAVDDDAVGRVDRATLKAIAGRTDVAHIVYVDAGYAEDDDELD